MIFLISFSISETIINLKAYFNNYYNLKKTFNLAEKLYNQGNINSAMGNYRKIEEKASKIIKLHNNSKFVDDALYMLAVSYSRLGEFTKAEQKFKELWTLFPNSNLINKAKIEYGIMLFNSNRLDEAVIFLSEINDKRAKFYLMKAYYKLGNYQKALEIANEIKNDKFFENNLDFKISLANIYLKTNNLNFAENLIEEITKISNINDTIKNNLLVNLSDAYLENQNFEKALKTINKINYKDSTSSEFFVKLKTSKILLMKGDTNKALEILEYLSNLAYDSTKFLSYYYLGIIYENKEDFDKALDFYEKAISGGVKLAQNRKEIIMKLKAMKDEKNYKKLYRLAETFYLDLNKPDLALNVLEKIINESDDEKLKNKAMLFSIYIYSKVLNDKQKAYEIYKNLNEPWLIDIARKWIE
ncbi:MAG: tetratricopeptide repeat protein [Candidatus Hydrothermia bacterium]|jgi:tetratricopeptide (TPR) repeat protein